MKTIFRRLSYASFVTALCVSCTLALQQGFNPNYDEAAVGNHPLPDPLKMNDGRPVSDAKQWRTRRAELVRLFETNVYGRAPEPPRKLFFTESMREPKALDGLATRKHVAVKLGEDANAPVIDLVLYVPNNRTGPAPVFLGLSFNGNHAVTNELDVPLSMRWMPESSGNGVVGHRATEKSRGIEARRWPLKMILARGYAVATAYYGDIFPDYADGRKDSIIPYFQKSAPGGDDWNAIAAWAWGLSRMLDYLEKDKDVDARRVAVWGHSRLGKASLWAGARDERFALVIANESGEGGAALARRNFGETVARINTAFPHWFAANYKKYNDDPSQLPVDQHELLALVAPRPLYVASAAEDLWADPRGEFLSAQAASPVYKLLGKDGLVATAMPAHHQPITSTIGYHIRAGKHDVTNYDWEQFLNFADKHLRGKR